MRLKDSTYIKMWTYLYPGDENPIWVNRPKPQTKKEKREETKRMVDIWQKQIDWSRILNPKKTYTKRR
mgnify:CR=1 FL=1